MIKLSYKLTLNTIYYGVFNREIHKVKLTNVKLNLQDEPIYNGYLLESKIFQTESLARKEILRNDIAQIKIIDKTI